MNHLGNMDSKFNIIEDITGANRVQDCKIDKGAYEYDGTGEITPVISSIILNLLSISSAHSSAPMLMQLLATLLARLML